MASNPPPQIKGITEADLQSWRHHPVSKVILQYLLDYQAGLRDQAWAYLLGNRVGPIDVEQLSELKGRASAALELAELPFETIQSFYTTEILEEENGTETVQDGTR